MVEQPAPIIQATTKTEQTQPNTQLESPPEILGDVEDVRTEIVDISPTWVRGFLLNDEGFKIWTEDRNITQVKPAALNLESLEL